MSKKRPPEPKKEGAPDWITTFVDMISLLVTFFILLYTFSTQQTYDVFAVKANFISKDGLIKPERQAEAIEPLDVDMMLGMDVDRGARIPHVRPTHELLQTLDEMGQKPEPENIEINPKDLGGGLKIHFHPDAAFSPGSMEPNAILKGRLIDLGGVIEHYPNLLTIVGHVDGQFTPTTHYPTADSLALARALAAAEVLSSQTGLDPTQIQVASDGDRNPIQPNDTAVGRHANRRVEVQILSLDSDRKLHFEQVHGVRGLNTESGEGRR